MKKCRDSVRSRARRAVHRARKDFVRPAPRRPRMILRRPKAVEGRSLDFFGPPPVRPVEYLVPYLSAGPEVQLADMRDFVDRIVAETFGLPQKFLGPGRLI